MRGLEALRRRGRGWGGWGSGGETGQGQGDTGTWIGYSMLSDETSKEIAKFPFVEMPAQSTIRSTPDCHSYCCKFTGLHYPTLACNFTGVPEPPGTQLFPWLPRDRLSLPWASRKFPTPTSAAWTTQTRFPRVELIVSDSELAFPPLFSCFI